jgi:hypothetical protein
VTYSQSPSSLKGRFFKNYHIVEKQQGQRAKTLPPSFLGSQALTAIAFDKSNIKISKENGMAQ